MSSSCYVSSIIMSTVKMTDWNIMYILYCMMHKPCVDWHRHVSSAMLTLQVILITCISGTLVIAWWASLARLRVFVYINCRVRDKGSQPSEVLVKRGLLILMGLPQDATIIEEDNQACLYASEIPHMSWGMRHLDLAELLIKERD